MHRIAGVLLSSALIACASAPRSGPETFQAKLDPASEVPAPSIGSAMPSGKASFTNDGSSIVYKVSVSGLGSAPVAAHIHVGAPGAAGPVIVPLVVVAGPGEGTAGGRGAGGRPGPFPPRRGARPPGGRRPSPGPARRTGARSRARRPSTRPRRDRPW